MTTKMTTKTSEEEVIACLSDIPQSQSDMAKQLGINRSNITGWLKKLESKGLAQQTINGHWIRAGTQQAQQHNNCNTTNATKQQNIDKTAKLKMAVRHYFVHHDTFKFFATTELVRKHLDELMDCENDAFDIKFNEFYDELYDLYNNSNITNYEKKRLRDGYIKLRDKYGYPMPNLRKE
jgi:biotin operon repressor